MRLKDKVVIVTGAAGSIGRASALLFAREGARVVGADRDEHGAEETANSIRDHDGIALALGVDVRTAASVAAMVARTEQTFGRLDAMFNNAGVLLPGDAGLVDTAWEVWEQTLRVNLSGVFLCCQHGIPALLRSGGGSIVNMGSMVAQVGSATAQVAYSASKGGVVALSREIAIEYGRRNVRVNALCPGPVRTPLIDGLFERPPDLERRRVHMPMGRFGEVDEIAAAALYLTSDDSSYVTGTAFFVDGGITAAYVTAQ